MEDRLRVLFWETTAACNLACRHCRRGEARLSAAPGELSTAEARALIGEVASWARPLLVLSGGEPLTRPDIVELAAFASARGLPVALATNGTMVEPGVAAALKKAGVRRASVSLDGAGAETHDRVRGVEGAFEAALRGLRTLKAAGLGTQVNMTVCRGNRADIPGVFRLAAHEGADAVHLFVLVPVGCGLELARDEALGRGEGHELFSWFHARAGSYGLEARLTCAPQYARFAAERGPAGPPSTTGGSAAGSGCLCGRSVVFVSHTGEIFPCGYLPVSAGSVRLAGLVEIWDKSTVLRSLRDPSRLGAPCKACAYREICGGCRARAYAGSGEMLAGEAGCTPG